MKNESEPQSEWTSNWKIPVVSAVGIAVSMIPIYSLGVLMPSIHAATGWTRSQISAGPTFLSVAAILLSPFAGSAIDRFGSRRIALPGMVVFCLTIALLSVTGPKLVSWWLIWTLVAISDVFVRVTVWTAAVVTHFDRARGLAIGIALSGTGIGSTFLPYLTTILQEHFGWRASFVILAGGGLLLALPLVWLYFYSASDKLRQSSSVATDRSLLSGTPPRQAFLSRRYLQMASACLFAAIASSGLAVHFVPILRSVNFSAHNAAAVAGAIGLSVILGRLAGGYLLDRFSGPVIGFISCALPVGAGPLLLLHHSQGAGVLAAVLIGLSTGSEIAVLSYLVPRYFGVRHFGLLFGVIGGLQTLGVGIGPVLAGSLFDRFGNYSEVLILSAPLFAASAILLGTLGRSNSLVPVGSTRVAEA